MGEEGSEDGEKPGKRLRRLGISCDGVATDDWDSFLSAFAEDNHDTGKKHTVGYRGEQLPDEAPDKAGVSEDVLFFPEAAESLEGVCHGVFLHQLWLRLITPSYFVDHLLYFLQISYYL
jgi:hypothetical protein